MIPRYSRPPMARIWEERAKMQKWLEVELAVCDVLAERGEIPKEAGREIRLKARFDPDRVAELEKTLRHDVVAFLENLSEHVGESARYIHLGLTSSDVLDTGLALQLVEAADLILEDLSRLREALRRRAFEHKLTPMAGRTHGVHAEPMSLGHKLALWYDEVGRHIARMERARESVRVGKLSGAVGNYAHLPPEVEEEVCKRLGLRPAPASSQIIQRDRHAEYVLALSLIAATIAKIATELRHLQRTEVREAEEPFGEAQKGSSAMPHKRNPVTAEQLCGLARVVQSHAQAALENVPLWHERDISHSSVERIILPDSTILVDYMLAKLAELIEGWVIRPERMRENLEAGGGLLFSQQVLLALIRKGMSREAAYRIVQATAMRAWEGAENFRALLEQDAEVGRRLTRAELEACFRLEPYMRHVDRIFGRVFGEGGQGG
ncbi:MAG: adenylosuccinate lyase [Nitrospinota bacterium]